MPAPNIVLASASPRRRELLSLMRLPFTTEPVTVDETFDPGETAERNVIRVAEKKARKAAETCKKNRSGAVILGADTTVVLDSEPLGKPSGYDEAFGMLSRLQGRDHRVMTGFALLEPQGRCSTGVETTRVEFAPMEEREIRTYLDAQLPFDKAGAYGIQDPLMSCFVRRIEGCYYNVVGLPLSRIHTLMRTLSLL